VRYEALKEWRETADAAAPPEDKRRIDLPIVRIAVPEALCERIAGDLQLRYLRERS
jgi:hypothetical protein